MKKKERDRERNVERSRRERKREVESNRVRVRQLYTAHCHACQAVTLPQSLALIDAFAPATPLLLQRPEHRHIQMPIINFIAGN